MAAPASVNENCPLVSNALVVTVVQEAMGREMLLEASKRKVAPEGPVAVRRTLPFGPWVMAVICGVSAIRKIVPPLPVPPFAVVP